MPVNIAVNCRRWLAPLLVAMAFALAPLFASAHGWHEHDAGEASAVDRAAPVASHAARQPVSAVLSSSCPSGPGNSCCCHIPTACAGAGQMPIVNAAGWVRPAPLPAARVGQSQVELLLQSQVVLSPALPRAPPLIS